MLQTINGLGKKARDGTISIDEMAGGTFTISNGGVYGSLLSTPIINPPQSAILGMHSINQRAMVKHLFRLTSPAGLQEICLLTILTCNQDIAAGHVNVTAPLHSLAKNGLPEANILSAVLISEMNLNLLHAEEHECPCRWLGRRFCHGPS
jgi:hypothetical protein